MTGPSLRGGCGTLHPPSNMGGEAFLAQIMNDKRFTVSEIEDTRTFVVVPAAARGGSTAKDA